MIQVKQSQIQMQGQGKQTIANAAIIQKGFETNKPRYAPVVEEKDTISNANSVKLFYSATSQPRARENNNYYSIAGMDNSQSVFKKSDQFKAKLQKLKEELAKKKIKNSVQNGSGKKRRKLEPIDLEKEKERSKSRGRHQNQNSRPSMQEINANIDKKSQQSNISSMYSDVHFNTKKPSYNRELNTDFVTTPFYPIFKEHISTPFDFQTRKKNDSPTRINAVCVGCGNFMNEDHPVNKSRSISKEKKRKSVSPPLGKSESQEKFKPFRYNQDTKQSNILKQTKSTVEEEEEIVVKVGNDQLKSLVHAFKKKRNDRSNKEIEIICKYLREIESFKRFCTEALLQIIDLIQLNKTKKGSMNEFDFTKYVILLKGQVFVMTHDRLNKDAQNQISKPFELPLDALLDPGTKDGIFLKMHYYGEDTLELKFDKEMFRRALAVDLLQVRQFPIFKHFNDTQFKNLYSKQQIHLIEQPGKTIYNINDKADSLFIVRQGVLHEQHEVPPKMKQMCHCRFYRPGQWFGVSEFMVQGNQRMSRVQNQVFEPKDGKVFYENNATNLIPTLIPLTEAADPQNPHDYMTINEYMIRQMDQNRTIAEYKQKNQNKSDGKLCRHCTMSEFREIESDLTILIEINYNDVLEQILENDPTLNQDLKKLCELVQKIRESIPDLVWMPIKKFANRSDVCATIVDEDYTDRKPQKQKKNKQLHKGPEIEFFWASMAQVFPKDPVCIVEHQRIEQKEREEWEKKLKMQKIQRS